MHQNTFPCIVLPYRQLTEPDVGPTWVNVAVETDLPSRLLIGDLVRGSFKKNASGWFAEYRHDRFRLTLQKSINGLQIEEFFDGISIGEHSLRANVAQTAILQQTAHAQRSWDETLNRFYTNQYNVAYVGLKDMGEGASGWQGFPDGFLHELILPIPFDEETFRDVVRALAEMYSAGIPLDGIIQFETHAINYRKGMCPDSLQQPETLAASIQERGFLLMGLPVWQGKESNMALTARRAAYVLRVSFPMRFGPQITACLFRHRLISPISTAYPEEAAVISHRYFLMQCQEIRFFSKDRSRRACYCGEVNDTTDNEVRKKSKGRTTLAEVEAHLNTALHHYFAFDRKPATTAMISQLPKKTFWRKLFDRGDKSRPS